MEPVLKVDEEAIWNKVSDVPLEKFKTFENYESRTEWKMFTFNKDVEQRKISPPNPGEVKIFISWSTMILIFFLGYFSTRMIFVCLTLFL